MPPLPALLVGFCAVAAAQDGADGLKKKFAELSARVRLVQAREAVVKVQADKPRTPEPDNDFDDPCLRFLKEDDQERAPCAGRAPARVKLRVSYQWDELKTPGGREIWMSQIEFQTKLETDLLVSAFYKPGTCPYNVTLAHERGHLADHEALWRAFPDAVKRALGDAEFPVKSAPEAISGDYGAAIRRKAAVEDRLNDVIKAERAALDVRLKAAIAARDTPEAYKKNDHSQCPKKDWRTDAP